jgi:hypothetical protein
VRSSFPDGIYLFINQFWIEKIDLEKNPKANINPVYNNPSNINPVNNNPINNNSIYNDPVIINPNNIDLEYPKDTNSNKRLLFNTQRDFIISIWAKYPFLNFKIINPNKLKGKTIYIIITKLNYSMVPNTNDEIPKRSYTILIEDISKIFPFYKKLFLVL